MTALTGLDWRYRALIYNPTKDRWESMDAVMPHEEHRTERGRADHYTAAEEAGIRDGHLLRIFQWSDVPEPK